MPELAVRELHPIDRHERAPAGRPEPSLLTPLRLLDSPADDAPRPAVDDLSPRQRQVLRRRAYGLRTKEIAHDLGISMQTVKNHITFTYIKLGVESLPEALVEVGWLRIPADDFE
jgi:DNA-binding NarL/FixJ family response regulator